MGRSVSPGFWYWEKEWGSFWERWDGWGFDLVKREWVAHSGHTTHAQKKKVELDEFVEEMMERREMKSVLIVALV